MTGRLSVATDQPLTQLHGTGFWLGFDQSSDQIFDKVFDQGGFDQVFDQMIDQKYSFTVLQGQEIQRTVLLGQTNPRTSKKIKNR